MESKWNDADEADGYHMATQCRTVSSSGDPVVDLDIMHIQYPPCAHLYLRILYYIYVYYIRMVENK